MHYFHCGLSKKLQIRLGRVFKIIIIIIIIIVVISTIIILIALTILKTFIKIIFHENMTFL